MKQQNHIEDKGLLLSCWVTIGAILQDACIQACKREIIKHPLSFYSYEDTSEPHLKRADVLLTLHNRHVQVELKNIKQRLTAWHIRNIVIPRFNGTTVGKVLIHRSSLTTGAQRMCRENGIKVFCINYEITDDNLVQLLQQIIYELTRLVIISRRTYVFKVFNGLDKTPLNLLQETPPLGG